MSNDLIRRNELLEGIDELIAGIAFTSPYQDELHCLIDGMERVRDRVAEAPTLTLDDLRPKGRWIGIGYEGYADGTPVYDYWECSECGEEVEGEDVPETHPFCYGCGADMRGGGEDEY